MRLDGVAFLAVLALAWGKNCPVKKSNSKLFCYYSKLRDVDDCYCSHAILPANSDVKAVDRARAQMRGVKILVTVNEFNQGLVDLLKTSKVDGLEIDLKKLDTKNDIIDFISTIRSKIGSDLYLALSVPAKAEILAKHFDFKSLSKHADTFILQTAFLGASGNVTFHPSRLSGLWDMQNTDSVVDLVSGLGAPLSKLVITAPVQAFHFTLQNEEFTAPGSPALKVKSLTRNQLCNVMKGATNWTLERDQDQAGPYIFSKDQWIAFEDSTSMDIKAKYSRVRGLAGLALKDVSQDGDDKCGPSILEAAYNGLSRQARAPRGAVLHSLEREILETARPLDRVQVSPYRISRVIDVEGKVHVIRQDTRTEFQCSRQGYFVHPRSCNRFYRCVKFDQLVEDFNVFEFDCPAGLAFDERVEVCVWPGSLPHGTPCSGSSEIAPVPKERFICPTEPGYYADPENCRWFFACLDHGRSPLSAYEFRCPFGLVFDSDRLMCEWPWLVPKCASGLGINLGSEFAYGGYSSGHGTGVVLQQYNGLGALGTVKLGGISGTLAQPAVYSNVGTAGLGYQNGGYINQGGYLTGSGLGGLNAKTAQSLENAGLLRLNLNHGNAALGLDNGVQYSLGSAGLANSNLNAVGGSSNQNLQYINGIGSGDVASSYTGAGEGIGIATSGQYQGNLGTSDSGLKLNQYQGVNGQVDFGNAVSQEANIGAGVFGIKTNQASLNNLDQGLNAYQYQANLGSNIYATGNAHDFGTKASQVFTQYQGQLLNQADANRYESGVNANLQNSGSNDLGAKSFQTLTQYHDQNKQITDNAGLNQQQVNLVYNAADINAFGEKIAPQNVIQYQGQIGQAAVGQNTASNFEVKSAQNLNQYQGEGVSGNINIVGGGYSAVAASKSGVEISNNGADIDAIVHSTPAPISIATFSSVPTVTSVPLPKLNTASGFESFNGGVIANVPQLQYKFNDNAVLRNSSLKFISTTPSTLENQNRGSYQSLYTSVDNQGYDYPRPSVAFEEGAGGQIASNQADASYSYTVSSTPRPSLTLLQQNAILPTSNIQRSEGYIYTKPSVAFEETPLKTVSTYSISMPTTARPILVEPQISVQPVVHVQQPNYAFNTQESHGQQGVIFGERQQPHIVVSSTPQPFVVEQRPQVYVSSTVAPIIQQKVPVVQQPAVSSYAFHRQESRGQGVIFGEREQPHIVVSSTPQPFVVEQQPQVYVSPTVAPIIQQKVPIVQQPAVSSYAFHRQESKGQQGAIFGERQQPYIVSSTPQPVIVEHQPQILVSSTAAPVSSYTFTQQVGSAGYNYPKPSIAFEEKPTRQPVAVSRFSIREPVQPAFVTSYNVQQPSVVQNVQPAVATYGYKQEYASGGYQYPRPSVVFPQPTVTYQKPAVSAYTYQNIAQQAVGVQSVYNVAPTTSAPSVLVQSQPVVSTIKPAVVSSYSYASKPIEFGGYNYPKPTVSFEERPEQPVEEVAFVKKKAYVTGQYKQPVVVENYQAPIYSQSVDASSAYFVNNVKQQYYSTPGYVQSTPRPTYQSTVIAAKAPVTEASNFYYYDSRLSSTPKTVDGYSYPQPQVKFEERPVETVTTTYLPPTREYLPAQTVTTSRPVLKYSFGSLDDQFQYVSTPRPFVVQSTTPLAEVSSLVPIRANVRYSTTSRPLVLATPSTAYLPVRSRVKVTTSTPIEVTTLARDYLPVRSRVSQIGDLSSRRPAKVTIIKQNDFQPILSAKLGAQCTCIADNLQSGKRKKIIIVEDDEDDDGYVVDNNQGGVVVENYQYNPQQRIDIAPTAQVYLQSTTNEIVPAPTPNYVRKRVRVHPVTSTVAYESNADQSEVSDGEVISAVRTGLKLVKQAAREGAKEGTQEAIGKYGNVNVRGAIECERAGLFRHPSQCNKFYACRWDCNKNKFTVHTFNCPIHLTFDNSLGACNWPSQGPACLENTLLPSE